MEVPEFRGSSNGQRVVEVESSQGCSGCHPHVGVMMVVLMGVGAFVADVPSACLIFLMSSSTFQTQSWDIDKERKYLRLAG